MRHGRHGPFLTRGMLERAVYRGTLAALRAHAAAPVPDHIADTAKMVAAEDAQAGLADAVAELVATLDDVGLAPARDEPEAAPEQTPDPVPEPEPATPEVSATPRDLVRVAAQARRMERKLTWRQAAEEMGLPASTLMNWYSGTDTGRVEAKVQLWLLTKPVLAPAPAVAREVLARAQPKKAPAPSEEAPPEPMAQAVQQLQDTAARVVPQIAEAGQRLAAAFVEGVRRMEEGTPQPAAPTATPAPAKPVVPPAPRQFPRPEKDRGGSVATSHQAVRAYLIERLVACRQGKLLASDRVAALTHAEALDRANEFRIRAGQLPFRFLGASAPSARGAAA